MRATLAFLLPIPTALLVATASAQSAAQAPDDPAASPFVSLDRSDGVSRIGVDLTHLDNAQGGGLLFGGALFGRYVDPRSGVGGYASLPFSLASGLKGSETTFELSGIELGVIYAHRFSPGVAIVAHAGFATAPLTDNADYLPYAGYANPSEFLNVFRGTKLKAGISPLLRAGKSVARLDLGGARVDESDVGTLIMFGAGAGYVTDRVSVMVELSGVVPVTEADPLANAWVTGRLDLGRVRPYLGLGTPLTEVRELFPWLIAVGADVVL